MIRFRNYKTLILLALTLSIISAFALQEPSDIISNFKLEGKSAIFFSAELNLSNGNPFTRDFGERGMFGKLVMSENISKNINEYIDDADRIFDEAKRLMLGPFFNGGQTELSYCRVSDGRQLELNSGKWIKSKGGLAIRLRHTTEYKNKIRYAYILISDMTLWKNGD